MESWSGGRTFLARQGANEADAKWAGCENREPYDATKAAFYPQRSHAAKSLRSAGKSFRSAGNQSLAKKPRVNQIHAIAQRAVSAAGDLDRDAADRSHI